MTETFPINMNAYLPTLRHHYNSNSYECIILDPKKRKKDYCMQTYKEVSYVVSEVYDISYSFKGFAICKSLPKREVELQISHVKL